MQFTVFSDADGRWRWRLEDRFLEALAESAQAFDSKGACLVAISRVKAAYAAPVYDATEASKTL